MRSKKKKKKLVTSVSALKRARQTLQSCPYICASGGKQCKESAWTCPLLLVDARSLSCMDVSLLLCLLSSCYINLTAAIDYCHACHQLSCSCHQAWSLGHGGLCHTCFYWATARAAYQATAGPCQIHSRYQVPLPCIVSAMPSLRSVMLASHL